MDEETKRKNDLREKELQASQEKHAKYDPPPPTQHEPREQQEAEADEHEGEDHAMNGNPDEYVTLETQNVTNLEHNKAFMMERCADFVGLQEIKVKATAIRKMIKGIRRKRMETNLRKIQRTV